MADTARSTAALLTILADNTSGAISPQDLRDVVKSFEAVNVVDAPGIGTNASLLTSGTVALARLHASVARLDQGQTFVGNQVVTGTLSVSSTLTAGTLSGSLAASNLTGTIADARQGTNVVLRNASTNQLQNGSTGGTTLSVKGNGSNGATLQIHSGGSNGLTLITDNAGNITHSSNRGVTYTFGADGGDYQIGGTGRDSTGAAINLFAGNCSSGASQGGSILLTAGASAEGSGGNIVLTPGGGDIESGIIDLNGSLTVRGAATFQDTLQANSTITCNSGIYADGGTIQGDILSSLSDTQVGGNLLIAGQFRPAVTAGTIDMTANITTLPVYDGEGSVIGYIPVCSLVG